MTRRGLLRGAMGAGVGLAAGGILQACGGGGDGAAATKAGPVSGSIEFLTGPLHPDDLKIQQGYARLFHQAHPDATVKVGLFDWGTMVPTLTTKFAGDRPPDLLHMGDSFWAKLGSQGAFADLTDRVHDSSFAASFKATRPQYWDALTYQDRIYGVPWLSGVYSCLYVNKSLMDDAGVKDYGSSMAAFRAAAAATRKGNVYGYAMPATFTDFGYQEWMNWVFNAGTNFLNEDQTAGALDTPDAAAAFDMLRAMHVEDRSTPVAGQYDRAGIEALFRAGRVAMLHDGSNAAIITGATEGKQLDFEWEVIPIPPGPGGQFVTVGYESLHIAAKSKDPDLAWAYLQSLVAPDRIVEYDRRIDAVLQPVRTDVVDRIYPKTAKFALAERFLEEFHPKGRIVQSHPRMIDCLRAATSELELCIRGKKTGAQMVHDANAQINEIVSGTAG
jgi:ABC-type glycerol-3-phosphate transport system substrate-binding protein